MSPEARRLLSGTDIRGEETELTDGFATGFGYAFALWLAGRLGTTPDKLAVAVGHDSRASGPRLERALIAGLTAVDADVLQCGLTTAPALYMTLSGEGRKADGAVMITAGDAPAGVNGFEMAARDGSPDAGDVREIAARAADAQVPVRLVEKIDSVASYRARLAAMARERLEDDAPKPLLGLHVVVDASGGAGGFYADFLEELGAETTGSSNLAPDGAFPAHAPSTNDPAALAALSDAVRENEADLGVLLNADCDRTAIVDGAGRAITGNRLIALISAILLNKTSGATIVTDSVTSSGLSRFISEWGGVHYRFKRGCKNVIDEAIRLNDEGIDCPLAIETSGHAAFRENEFLDDGMHLATRIVCEAYDKKRFGETISDYLDCLHESVEAKEIRFRMDDGDWTEESNDIIEMILSHTLENPLWRLATDSREGVRILFNLDGGVENAWFQLRMSVNDPEVMVLNAESDVRGGVGRILGELYALLRGNCASDLAALRDACA